MTPHKILAITIFLLLSAIPPLQAAQFLLTPSLFFSEEYTDNVDLDPNNQKEDYISTAGLNLNGQILSRTAGLELNYNPSYSKYGNNEDYDNWRHEASLHTWKDIKRYTRLELRNTYLYSNDPQDESEAIDADDPTQGQAIESDANRRDRDVYATNTALARLSHQFGSDDSFYLAYQYSILRDQDVREDETLEDNDISTPSVGLVYNFTTRWGMDLDASYAITDYEAETERDRDEFNGEIRFFRNFNRAFSAFIAYQHTALNYDEKTDQATALDSDEETDESYQILRPSIGIMINFQDNASITIDGGYYFQKFEPSDDPTVEPSEDDEGFNIDSDIYKRWVYRSGYFGISGGSGYEIDDDGTEDNGLTIYYEGGFSAGYSFTPRLSSNMSCLYRYEDFPNETPNRVDKTLTAGAGLDWQALNWMSIGLSYNYSNVASDDPTNEYVENSAIITIRMTPTSPYRLN